jgi:hypothetical protein
MNGEKDLRNAIKSLDKTDYRYTCEQEPLCSHCDKEACGLQKYGYKAAVQDATEQRFFQEDWKQRKSAEAAAIKILGGLKHVSADLGHAIITAAYEQEGITPDLDDYARLLATEPAELVGLSEEARIVWAHIHRPGTPEEQRLAHHAMYRMPDMEQFFLRLVTEGPHVLKHRYMRRLGRELLDTPGVGFILREELRGIGRGFDIDQLRALIEEYENYAIRPPVHFLDSLAAVEAAQTQHRWLFHELFPASGVGLWCAGPKVGKSTTMRYCAYCVAHGLPFLDRKYTHERPGRVLWVTSDETYEQVCEGMRALHSDKPNNGRIYTLQGYMSPGRMVDLVEEKIEAMQDDPVRLVIVDTLADVVNIEDGTNDYGKVRQQYQAFKARSSRWSAPVVLLYHSNKSEKFDLSTIMGSQAFRASSDFIYLLGADGAGHRMLGEVRGADKLSETDIRIDFPHCSVKLCNETEVAAKRRKELKEVYAVVKEYPNGILGSDLAGKLSGEKADRLRKVREAEGRGTIKETTGKQRGKMYVAQTDPDSLTSEDLDIPF